MTIKDKQNIRDETIARILNIFRGNEKWIIVGTISILNECNDHLIKSIHLESFKWKCYSKDIDKYMSLIKYINKRLGESNG